MCKKSESIAMLAKALIGFNGEVTKIEKDSVNPHFKNNYASLDNIIDEIRPILTKHGLSIIQMPGGDGEMFSMTTMLVHESGEWIESDPIKMRPVKNDPQGIGSCTTYARRYSLSAFLSLNTGEDDDGYAATHDGSPKASGGASNGRQSQPSETRTSIQPAANGQSGQRQGVQNGLNAKSRVLNLKTEMGWDWDAMGSFATDVLGRTISKVISDIKTEDEWKKVEEAMLITKQAS